MRRLVIAILIVAFTGIGQAGPQQAGGEQSTIPVLANTRVWLALTNPILARSAKPGDAIHAVSAFPVTQGNRIVIPAGTYALGQIDTLTRPSWRSHEAQIQVHFTRLIFASGYTVTLPDSLTPSSAASPSTDGDVIPAVANFLVQASRANDVLLENGSSIEMVLQLPLQLDAGAVAASAALPNPAPARPRRSATRCRPTPETPGSPDMVVPPPQDTSGTPPTVVFSLPTNSNRGIPGIPGAPGKPGSVIPGSHGTPATSCPEPPSVINDPGRHFRGTFQIDTSLAVAGKQLPQGGYMVTWTGPAPEASVEIYAGAKPVATVGARVVVLATRAAADRVETRAGASGLSSVRSLRFAGQAVALYFDADPD